MPSEDKNPEDKGPEELFDLVDANGTLVGKASRARCHSDPSLLHRVVHIFVFNEAGEVFLQKRSLAKDIQPGKWDTSVGGHVALGESVEAAARREMIEELGLQHLTPAFVHEYIWRSSVESELVRTYRCVHEGPFALQRDEIIEGGFFSLEAVRRMARAGLLTPNLEHELRLLGFL
jgi:isopentenyldiphosphate isomerase